MDLSIFGSWENLISVVLSLLSGFSIGRFSVKKNWQINKLSSFVNTGKIIQKNESHE